MELTLRNFLDIHKYFDKGFWFSWILTEHKKYSKK